MKFSEWSGQGCRHTEPWPFLRTWQSAATAVASVALPLGRSVGNKQARVQTRAYLVETARCLPPCACSCASPARKLCPAGLICSRPHRGPRASGSTEAALPAAHTPWLAPGGLLWLWGHGEQKSELVTEEDSTVNLVGRRTKRTPEGSLPSRVSFSPSSFRPLPGCWSCPSQCFRQ